MPILDASKVADEISSIANEEISVKQGKALISKSDALSGEIKSIAESLDRADEIRSAISETPTISEISLAQKPEEPTEQASSLLYPESQRIQDAEQVRALYPGIDIGASKERLPDFKDVEDTRAAYSTGMMLSAFPFLTPQLEKSDIFQGLKQKHPAAMALGKGVMDVAKFIGAGQVFSLAAPWFANLGFVRDMADIAPALSVAGHQITNPMIYQRLAARVATRASTRAAVTGYNELSKALVDEQGVSLKDVAGKVLKSGAKGATLGLAEGIENSYLHMGMAALIGAGWATWDQSKAKTEEVRKRAKTYSDSLESGAFTLNDYENIALNTAITTIVESFGHRQLQEAWKNYGLNDLGRRILETKLTSGITDPQEQARIINDYYAELKFIQGNKAAILSELNKRAFENRGQLDTAIAKLGMEPQSDDLFRIKALEEKEKFLLTQIDDLAKQMVARNTGEEFKHFEDWRQELVKHLKAESFYEWVATPAKNPTEGYVKLIANNLPQQFLENAGSDFVRHIKAGVDAGFSFETMLNDALMLTKPDVAIRRDGTIARVAPDEPLPEGLPRYKDFMAHEDNMLLLEVTTRMPKDYMHMFNIGFLGKVKQFKAEGDPTDLAITRAIEDTKLVPMPTPTKGAARKTPELYDQYEAREEEVINAYKFPWKKPKVEPIIEPAMIPEDLPPGPTVDTTLYDIDAVEAPVEAPVETPVEVQKPAKLKTMSQLFRERRAASAKAAKIEKQGKKKMSEFLTKKPETIPEPPPAEVVTPAPPVYEPMVVKSATAMPIEDTVAEEAKETKWQGDLKGLHKELVTRGFKAEKAYALIGKMMEGKLTGKEIKLMESVFDDKLDELANPEPSPIMEEPDIEEAAAPAKIPPASIETPPELPTKAPSIPESAITTTESIKETVGATESITDLKRKQAKTIKQILNLEAYDVSHIKGMRAEVAEGAPGKRVWSEIPPEEAYSAEHQGPPGFIIKGEPSSYPEYFKNKGYLKEDILKIIDKVLNGEPTTGLMRSKFDDLYQHREQLFAEQLARMEAKYSDEISTTEEDARAAGVSESAIKKAEADGENEAKNEVNAEDYSLLDPFQRAFYEAIDEVTSTAISFRMNATVIAKDHQGHDIALARGEEYMKHPIDKDKITLTGGAGKSFIINSADLPAIEKNATQLSETDQPMAGGISPQNYYKMRVHALKKKHEIDDASYKKIALETVGKDSMVDMDMEEQRLFFEEIQRQAKSIAAMKRQQKDTTTLVNEPLKESSLEKYPFANKEIIERWEAQDPKKPRAIMWHEFFKGARTVVKDIGAKDLFKDLFTQTNETRLKEADIKNALNKIMAEVRKQAPISERIKASAMKRATTPEQHIRDMLDKISKINPNDPSISEPDRKAFIFLRDLTQDMLKRVNVVLKQLGLPEIKGIDAYVPHFLDDAAAFLAAELGANFSAAGEIAKIGPFPIPEIVKRQVEKRASNFRKIPEQYERKIKDELAEIFSKNPQYLFEAFIHHNLKIIYLALPNRVLLDTLNAALEKNAIDKTFYQDCINIVNYNVYRMGHPIDERLDLYTSRTGMTKLINKCLYPLNRTMKSPIRTMSRVYRRLAAMMSVPGRPDIIASIILDRLIPLAKGYHVRDYLKSQFTKAEPKVAAMIDNLINVRLVGKPEDVPGMMSFVEKMGYYPVTKARVNSAKSIAYTAYYSMKREGATDEKALEVANTEISDAMLIYNTLEMPMLTRSQAGRMANMMANTWEHAVFVRGSEILRELIWGRNASGEKIPGRRRLNAIKNMILLLGLLEFVRRKTGMIFGRFYGAVATKGALVVLSPVVNGTIGFMQMLGANSDWERKAGARRVWTSLSYPFRPKAWMEFRDFMQGKTSWQTWLSFTPRPYAKKSNKGGKKSSYGKAFSSMGR